MDTFQRHSRIFGGWRGAIFLLIAYSASEVGLPLLRINGFLFVTVHFVAMPLCSFYLAILTIRRAIREGPLWRRALMLCSLIIPAAIVSIAVTGELPIQRWLDISYNNGGFPALGE